MNGQALSHHEIELRWDKPKPANGNLKPYEVSCHEVGGNSSANVQTTKRLVIFKNLLPKTLYKCTVKASTLPEKEQNPKECEVLVESSPIQTLDFGASIVTTSV